MHLPFRDFHILRFFQQWWPNKHTTALRALDKALYLYFRENKSLGAKDREFIAQTVYQCIRWKTTLDALCQQEPTWEERLELFHQGALNDLKHLKVHEQVGMPEEFFQIVEKDFGTEEAIRLSKILQETAPVFIRANRLKITRDELLKILPDSWQAKASNFQDSICLGVRAAVFQSEAFKNGFFEMQDEGSQVLADCVDCHPGDWVLDYCAGSGGKSLALAAKLNHKGQIFLHDIRLHALAEARKRLKRAGIQNAQLLDPEHRQLKRLKKSCDWVLVDAPCSGSGTLRRNPDMKIRLTGEYIKDLVELQRKIVAQAIEYLKPSGILAYATCSFLKAENEDQLEYFLYEHSLEIFKKELKLLPSRASHDGFYCVLLRKKQAI
jgi:16S rRNA (cytosine967-C5)-methyltransferase